MVLASKSIRMSTKKRANLRPVVFSRKQVG